MSKEAKMDPAILEYVAEGKEIIERISKNLSLIESNQFDQEILNLLYRDVHTLKGSSQLFGFKWTGQVSHTLEACLDPVRKGVMKINHHLMMACVKSIDLLDRLVSSIEKTGQEFENEVEVVKLISLLVETSTKSDRSDFVLIKDSLRIGDVLIKQDQIIDKKPSEVHSTELEYKNSEMKDSSMTKIKDGLSKRNDDSQVSLNSGSASLGAPLATPPLEIGTAGGGVVAQNGIGSGAMVLGDATVRVHVSLLDRILNLIGELVLVRNQLLQFRHKVDNVDFQNTSKSLDVVTSELQGEVMKTRMQPVETIVGKFQRVVRDISREMGKKIDLTLEGVDTELDKSMLEAIKDPLTHIVRNSCDHGIEFPEERLKANKPETGHLLIRSFHEGGQVVIEISDDGRGINRKRVLQKAIEKGMLTAEMGSKLSDREICALIFSPGFSTAQQVTSVSGRGVGMDVVKTNIEKIGGSVEIKSVEGKGTSLQLRIPLTLAIVPALIIKSNREKFAIPQVKLIELVRVQGRLQEQALGANGSGSVTAQIELLQGRPMFRLRGSLLPLYDLREITGESFDSSYSEGIFIVVLNSDGETFGLLVPEVLDTADIVVKPISQLLNTLSTFSGATILGDGSIALILDVGGVALHGKVINKRSQKEDRESFSKQERARISTDIQEFLLFSVGTNAVHSIPLCLVNRLEEFSEKDIEQSGEQKIVRYRGSLLPLIHLKSVLKYSQTSHSSQNGKNGSGVTFDSDRISVVVVQRSGRNYGLIVDKIVDVMTIDGQIDDSIRDRSGILGNILFNEEVVVVVDALGVIEDFNRSLVGHNGSQGSQQSSPRDVMGELRGLNKEMKFKSVRVLYAEDVAFFRKHVSKVLAGAGIDITTFEDGIKALQELDSAESDRYNLILSDIEMPNMNGLELAREIRKRERYQNIPMIALTTRYRESDIQDGKKAGFNNYLEKLNPEKLLEAIHEIMSASHKINTQVNSQDIFLKGADRI